MSYHFSSRMASLSGTATREIFKLLTRPEIISFAGGLPANEFLPVEDVAQITAEILASDTARKILQYGVTDGLLPLREILTAYVEDVGIQDAALDNTLVISGGQQGIDLMCKTFLDKGDVVLVEDPTYLAILQIFNAYEAKAVGVKTVKDGLDLDDLEQKMIQLKPKFLYVVPTFSNPTGKTYSASNRKSIAQLASKYHIPVLEDDPYGKLRYSGEEVPALKAFDTSGHVVYISSFSKILSPGLRTGVAIGAPEIIRKMSIGKQGTDLHTSNLSQAVTYEYLKRGKLYPNIEKAVPMYRERRDAMLGALEKYMPDEFIYTRPEGGLFIWGEFPVGIDTVKIFPEAVGQNVAYIQGQVFYADGKGLNTLRLNFSTEPPERIEKGIKILGKLFKQKLSDAKNQI
ncbi:MAG: PLP-dependent aminotransferase family protein [Firmicutes bacterium]|nr:PLP-dependent aminotransferase family protein [Bacillota bacterium]